VTRIVTIDQHACNIIKNEYQDFGYQAEIYHHTQMMFDLVMLVPKVKLGKGWHITIPAILADPGIELVEMERSKEIRYAAVLVVA